MKNPLNIAFVWHMHQPNYKDPSTGQYLLPWVLLHATKDYLDMATILDDFPDIKQTFNLTPVLLEQIIEYSSGEVDDKFRSVSIKPANELNISDRVFIL
ncbi:MAG: glycoside hydrolase, partial [Deltaproteobacteria bacterium]|nr:glycoside hydrolase [Deltaproteobacteria bacterium]